MFDLVLKNALLCTQFIQLDFEQFITNVSLSASLFHFTVSKTSLVLMFTGCTDYFLHALIVALFQLLLEQCSN